MIISEMQNKLAIWSTNNKERKFDRLLRLISHRDWLAEAARITLSAKGANTPGVDGIRKKDLQDNPKYLEDLRSELLAGTYIPQPARRVYIPKSGGKGQRPLSIPCLRDRIAQRAMLMAMEPIWESDFHCLSYGFRPARSVHHAVRTVTIQLQDNQNMSGRWIIEGDLASYFDTVHHKLLMKSVRKRICDKRFLNLLWTILKAGCIDRNLFLAANQGVPQGGVLSPLLSNIMLNEFDHYLDKKYLSKKARKDRWYWNDSIKRRRPIAIQEGRQWKPAVAYCRYADDFVITVKGSKQEAITIREECREFLEGDLNLTLNMEKTHITHVNDGFIFLGHRIIRKRGPKGNRRIVTTIPKEKSKNFQAKLVKELSTNYSQSAIDMIDGLNRKIAGWANFYQFTTYTGKVFSRIDHVVFWKFAKWLARKYRTKIKQLIIKWVRCPSDSLRKTWFFFGYSNNGIYMGKALKSLSEKKRGEFRWANTKGNPYLLENQKCPRFESYYSEIAMALSQS